MKRGDLLPCIGGCGRDESLPLARWCCMACGKPDHPFADRRSTTGHTTTCEMRNRWPDLPMPNDTPDVPSVWGDWRFEYIDGYRNALKGPGVYCPVAHRGVESHARREAWKAGRTAGNAERKWREKIQLRAKPK